MFSACSKIGTLISQIPFVTEDSRSQSVLSKPSSWQTGPEMLAGIGFDLALHGNAYIVVLRAPAGRVAGLAPLNPENVRVAAGAMGEPTYTDTRTGQTWGRNDVIHFRDPGCGSHGLVSQSRLQAAGVRVRILIAADALISNSIDKGISVQYQVTSDNPISAKRAKSIAKVLYNLFNPKDGSRTGGAAVLGDTKLEKISGITPMDLDLRNLRNDLSREISAIYSLPRFMVDGDASSRYANFSASTGAVLRDLCAPLAIAIAARFERALGSPVSPMLSALIMGDFDLASRVSLAIAGGPIATINEARTQIFGLPPDSDPASSRIRQSRIGQTPAIPGDREGENDGEPNPED